MYVVNGSDGRCLVAVRLIVGVRYLERPLREVLLYIYIFVSKGRPFGPAWAPCNAQRANVGPAGRGSMVNIIALKTATLVLSRS